MAKVKVILGKGATSFYDPEQAPDFQKVYPGQIVEMERTDKVNRYLKGDGLLKANEANLELMNIPNPDTEEGKAEIERRKKVELENNSKPGEQILAVASPTPTPAPASTDMEGLAAEAKLHEAKESASVAAENAATAQHEANQSGLELETQKQATINAELELVKAKLELAKAEKEAAGKKGAKAEKPAGETTETGGGAGGGQS